MNEFICNEILSPKMLYMSLLNSGFSKEESKEYSGLVFDIFGFEERVTDNLITYDTRKKFRKMQNKKILVGGSDEYHISDTGSVFTIHWWHLNKEKIISFSRQVTLKEENPDQKSEDAKEQKYFSSLYNDAFKNLRKTKIFRT